RPTCKRDHTRFLVDPRAAVRSPHSFPTRRSSDLVRQGAPGRARRRRLPAARRPDQGGLDGAADVGPGARRPALLDRVVEQREDEDRKSTRLNSSHVKISYAVFCLKKKNKLSNTYE